VLGAGAAGARAAEYAAELIPIYPATARIASWRIADSIKILLDVLDWPDDPLPADLRAREHLASYADALRGIHRPADRADVRRSRTRLKWDEALVLQVALAQAAGGGRLFRHPAPGRDGRAARRVRRRAAVRADRGPGARGRDDQRRAGP
jgi:ATP-dependent DNA helicase RecG